jgi:pimeloyl-ACP methyl ester carboxylesterase
MPYIDLSDTRCYFEQMGHGDPLLLIPGLGRTCRLWDAIAEQLGQNFSLIMPDNRGVGRSQSKKHPRHLRELAIDLIELLDALGVERTHVLGISFGGVVAQWLAVEHPSRINKLVLISTAHQFGPYLTEMARLIGHALRYFPRNLFERTVEILGSSPRFIDEYPEGIMQRIAAHREVNLPRSAVGRQLICLGSSGATREQYRITAPTLVMAGQHDALIPGCYGREIARDIPGSEFVELPECGHNPFIEMPDFAVAKIVEFLMRDHGQPGSRWSSKPLREQWKSQIGSGVMSLVG